MERGPIWVLAMTATRARILRGLGRSDGAGPADLVLRTDHRHLRRLMEAPPGPAAASEDLAADEREFVRQVVQVLETHRLAGDFRGLVVFAAPAILRALRAEMPARLAARILSERPRCVILMETGAITELARADVLALQT